MADIKLSQLTEDVAPTVDDLLLTTDIGTISSKKVTIDSVGNTIFTSKDTDDLVEGSSNLYYLTSRFDIDFATKDTDDLAEGTNLYYTEVRVSANTDVVTNTAKVGVTTEISDIVEDTTPQLGGDLDYNSNGVKIIGQTVGGSDGNAVRLSGSNTWSTADASAEATVKTALGIRINATDVLVHGVYTTTGLTAGSLYYVSETAGAITVTIPTTSGSIVRPIAYALTTTELYVFPSGSYVENL